MKARNVGGIVSACVALCMCLVLLGCGNTAASPSGGGGSATAPAGTSGDGSGSSNGTAAPPSVPSAANPPVASAAYTLTGSAEVDGRQGVAAEGGMRWVSGSTSLSRYDADWNLLATNDDPFSKGYELEVNHIGDIDVYKGEVYCGVELFVDGVAKNIQIAIYDGTTLELSRTFNFAPESGQDECSGIAVNPDEGTVDMCAWTDAGAYLYRYDLHTGAYLGKVKLEPAPKWQQGVAYRNGFYYFTSDDGDADKNKPDHVYRAKIPLGAQSADVVEELALEDVQRQGEIEGLTFTDEGQLLVLYNRGAIIVEGMPTGFYDGYDHEIHEVYAYDVAS